MIDKKGALPAQETCQQSIEISPIVLFKALSDELRLVSMLLIRRRQELCVCELTEALDVSQPKVSRHLAILRDTGLVATERRGQWIYYSIPPTLPAWVFRVLDETAAHNEAVLKSPLAKLQAIVDRPTMQCP
ncbi:MULTISPECIES: ArsR/SmtB family transcription factor [unclassified Marinobacter]|uniref:ArsR/SmtB family transcription factor n=1 Tax=unclassified Marinobacter TaxID=83889 RepID=UPI0019031F06|nr:metalloregulator ArsR/SmtB family transcription factor [Marinobacter sp. 1-4A]MBK1850883.1 metalloregulator ArsR/SmtB family transcription factor [Marinobacter sp. 1-4A]